MTASIMNIDFSGPSFCLMSGASKGIGRAIAIEVSKNLVPKSVLLLWARNKQQLAITASLCESNGVKVLFQSIDLSTASEKEMNDNILLALSGHKVTEFTNCLIYHDANSVGKLPVKTTRVGNVEGMRHYYDLNVSKVKSLNTQFVKIFEQIENRYTMVSLTSQNEEKPMVGNAYHSSGKAENEISFKVPEVEKTNIKFVNYCPKPMHSDMIDYALSEKLNENFNHTITTFQTRGTVEKPDVAAEKIMKMLLSGKSSPGEHIN